MLIYIHLKPEERDKRGGKGRKEISQRMASSLSTLVYSAPTNFKNSYSSTTPRLSPKRSKTASFPITHASTLADSSALLHAAKHTVWFPNSFLALF